MGRMRTVKPVFFQHELLFEAEQKTGLPLRLAYIGLWTQADREGRFEWRPLRLKANILPWDALDFGAVLCALADHGFIIRYEADGRTYGAIPAWSKHQKPHHQEAESEHPPPPSSERLRAKARTASDHGANGFHSENGERETENGSLRTGVSASPTPPVTVQPSTSPGPQPDKPAPTRQRDELFDAVVEVTASDPKVSGSHVGRVCKALRSAEPAYTPAEVRAFGELVRTWKGFTGPPTLGTVEKCIGQVRAPKEQGHGPRTGTETRARGDGAKPASRFRAAQRYEGDDAGASSTTASTRSTGASP